MSVERARLPMFPEEKNPLRAIDDIIAAATYEHEYGGGWYKVSHAGLVESLEIVPPLLREYRLRGIHLSCQSGKHEVVGDPEKTYTIWCLVFTEKQSDYVRYHLSYATVEPLSMDAVTADLNQILMKNGVTNVVWTNKTTISASCNYTTK